MFAFVKGDLLYHLYWGVTAGIVVGGGKLLKLPEELYRKLVHLCVVFSIFPAVLTVSTWQQAALICLLFMAKRVWKALWQCSMCLSCPFSQFIVIIPL